MCLPDCGVSLCSYPMRGPGHCPARNLFHWKHNRPGGSCNDSRTGCGHMHLLLHHPTNRSGRQQQHRRAAAVHAFPHKQHDFRLSGEQQCVNMCRMIGTCGLGQPQAHGGCGDIDLDSPRRWTACMGVCVRRLGGYLWASPAARWAGHSQSGTC